MAKTMQIKSITCLLKFNTNEMSRNSSAKGQGVERREGRGDGGMGVCLNRIWVTERVRV